MTQLYRAAALLAGLALTALAALPAYGQGALQGLPHTPLPQASPVLGAHARYSKAPINLGPANLGLAVAMIAAGGGETAFSANNLIDALTGGGAAAQSEFAALTKKFGADKVASFEKTFNFFISDALAQVTQDGMALPAPTGTADPKALAAELYLAGKTPGGKYDVEYMFDSLVSHIVDVAVMNDIDANADLGPTADANFHFVFAQFSLDLKKLYDL